ncbi:S8 family serine peptidase [Paenibacillus sp. OV219]|uniref:S8 family serine peptidase n=1 Tax=Paenibacillus sp. OV219 TaxID=1884377 RepID=UPI0008B01FE8|nr:S8 family serine peptidase [Paenibacillus sp. OV219]SEN55652.1 peptidase Vpr. Serine peptidase. MEROPS family S08A [Paenibacillus sp. OV219]
MKQSRWNKLVAKVAVGSMLLSMSLPVYAYASDTHSDAIRLISQLSFDQKKALQQMKLEQPVLSTDLNTKSSAPTKVIVEFKQAPAEIEVLKQASEGVRISLREAAENAEDNHVTFQKFVQQLAGQNGEGATPFTVGEVEITREYRHAFNGVAMTLPGNVIESLLKSGVVKHIYKDSIVKLDPKEMEAPTDAVQPLDAPSANNTIPLNGIYDLHAAGITGKGIKVGVLDTGIDYNHPDLTDAYKGYRAQDGVDPKSIDPTSVKGWDEVDNDADPMETTYADWQASEMEEHQGDGTYYTYHGTHVSGTIAARAMNAATDSPALGVAPEADLYVYRVLGPYGQGSDSAIMAGIDKSVQDGMDVINLSLGVMENNALLPESIAINNATLLGVVCAVAAGNMGPGERTVTAPGAAPLALTVGASDFALTIATMTGSAADAAGSVPLSELKVMAVNYNPLADLLDIGLPLVDVGLASAADFEGKDLTGKIALIQRGDLTLSDKIVNAAKAGAVAAIMYNNVDGEIPFVGDGTEYIPTFRTSQEVGADLKAMVEPTVTFSSIGSTETEGGHLADFSGRGPVNGSNDIKPDVVGPGVSVYSTYPEYIHSPETGIDYSHAYARISGTSMATPHVAGIVALMLQHHRDLYPNEDKKLFTPFDVRAALMNTADDLNGDYSVYQVGAGEVDVTEAVNATVSIQVLNTARSQDENGLPIMIDNPSGLINYGTLAPNEGKDMKDSSEMTITNNSDTDKTFTLSSEYYEGGAISATANNVTVNVNGTDTVTVEAGSSVPVNVNIVIPMTAAKGKYEGYIHLANAENAEEHYQLPFAIRVVEPGINSMYMTNPAIMSEYPAVAHPFQDTQKFMMFTLNSPMQEIDTVVMDKHGNPIGTFTPEVIDATDAPLDQELWVMVGEWMYPYIGDPSDRVVSPEPVLLEEGDYSLRMVAKDEQERTFTKDQMFIIDNTRPQLKFLDKPPGVYEVTDSMFTTEEFDGTSTDAIWIHANLFDKGTAKLAPLGITQSANHLFYYLNTISESYDDFKVEANGNVKFGITRDDLIDPETLQDKPMTLALFPIDLATNGYLIADFQHYGFIKAGSPYVVPVYDKDRLYEGDEVTMTLNLNNVEDLVAGKYDVSYYQFMQFENVKVNDAFQAMADAAGATVTLDEPIIRDDEVWTSKKIVNVGASVSGNEFAGFDGDTPFLDVTFKLVDDENYTGLDKMNIEQNIEKFNYTKAGAQEPTEIPVFNQIDGYQVIPKHSMIQGSVYPEALMTFYEDGHGELDWSKDFATIGAKATATVDGQTYNGVISSNGSVMFDQIPVSENKTEFRVEIPGHLTSTASVKLGRSMYDEWVGENGIMPQMLNYAGDVNGDGMIDTADATALQNQMGATDDPALPGDLNKDGVVDETDLHFVENNLLRVADPLTLTKASETTAQLKLKMPAGATGVSLEQSRDGGATWTASVTEEPIPLAGGTVTVTKLSPGKAYGFRLLVTGGPETRISDVVAVTTSKAPQVVIPPVPDNTVTVSDDGVVLTPGAGQIHVDTSADGKKHVTVAPNAADLAKSFDMLQKSDESKQTIIIKVEQEADSIDIDLPSDVLAAAAASNPHAVISIEASNSSFKLPIGAADLQAAADKLGSDLSGMTVTISMSTPTAEQQKSIDESAKAHHLNVVSVVSFMVTVSANGKSEELTNFGSIYVTRTIAVDGQDSGKSYMAVLIDPITGELSFIPATVSNKDGLVEASIFAPHASLYGIAQLAPKSFADVAAHWAKDEIELLAARQLVKGMSAEQFSPGSTVTRAEFAALLARALGLEMVNTTTSFTDVPADKWYATAVHAVVEAGIVKGRSKDQFAPNATITREEMAVMLAGALKFAGKAEGEQTPLTFTDKDSIASWAQAAVAQAAGAGILQGNKEGAFAPKSNATRAEAAVVLKRWLTSVGFIN